MSLSLSVRRNTAVDRIIEKNCYICNSVMPPYCFHCASCGRCVAYMDHHCPWINNCVGFYTQKLFVLFNFYGLISLAYAGILITREYLTEVFSIDQLDEINYDTVMAGVSLFLICVSFLFMLTVFTD